MQKSSNALVWYSLHYILLRLKCLNKILHVLNCFEISKKKRKKKWRYTELWWKSTIPSQNTMLNTFRAGWHVKILLFYLIILITDHIHVLQSHWLKRNIQCPGKFCLLVWLPLGWNKQHLHELRNKNVWREYELPEHYTRTMSQRNMKILRKTDGEFKLNIKNNCI